jgi:hypothetical protein
LSIAATQCGTGSPEPTASSAARQVQQFLDTRYAKSDVRHHFRTRLGDEVDCIDFEAQAGVKSLRARGLSVQTVPPPSLANHRTPRTTTPAFDGQPDEDGNLRACPAGTVAERRLSAERIAAHGLDAFLNATHTKRFPPGDQMDAPDYQHAVGQFNEDNQGGRINMPVFATPIVDSCPVPSEACGSSLMAEQIWAVAVTNGVTQTVEAGWHIDSDIEGDYSPHLWIGATADSYRTTWCYNDVPNFRTGQSCVMWVGTSSLMLLNATLTPGETILVETLNPTGLGGDPNWWIYVETDEGSDVLGYFAASAYGNIAGSNMQTHAQLFEAGGEIYDPRNQFVNLPMGSGHCAEDDAWAGSGDSYYDFGAYLNNGGTLNVDYTQYTTLATREHDYEITEIFEPVGHNSQFYAGGPGPGPGGSPGPCCATCTQ